MSIHEIIALVCMGAGVCFLATAAFSIYKLPDFYTRHHGAGIGDTLGALLLTIGMMIITGAKLLTIKVLIVFILLMITNPLGTNLIMIAAIQKNNYQNYSNMRVPESAAEEGEGGNDANINN